MNKVTVTIEHKGVKKEVVSDFILLCCANEDESRVATAIVISGIADVLNLNRAYLKLGAGISELIKNQVYGFVSEDEKTKMVEDIMPQVRDWEGNK